MVRTMSFHLAFQHPIRSRKVLSPRKALTVSAIEVREEATSPMLACCIQQGATVAYKGGGKQKAHAYVLPMPYSNEL